MKHLKNLLRRARNQAVKVGKCSAKCMGVCKS